MARAVALVATLVLLLLAGARADSVTFSSVTAGSLGGNIQGTNVVPFDTITTADQVTPSRLCVNQDRSTVLLTGNTDRAVAALNLDVTGAGGGRLAVLSATEFVSDSVQVTKNAKNIAERVHLCFDGLVSLACQRTTLTHACSAFHDAPSAWHRGQPFLSGQVPAEPYPDLHTRRPHRHTRVDGYQCSAQRQRRRSVAGRLQQRQRQPLPEPHRHPN